MVRECKRLGDELKPSVMMKVIWDSLDVRFTTDKRASQDILGEMLSGPLVTMKDGGSLCQLLGTCNLARTFVK